MVRTFQIALFSAMLMVAACKKADQPAPVAAEPVTKATTPMKPGDPAKPADPAAKPGDPAAPPATGNNELENKGLAMMSRMADLFAADARDCEKLATDITAFIAQNKALIGQLTAMEKQQSPQDRAAFEARNKAVQQEVMTKVTPTMTACKDNKNVQAAMTSLAAD
jgi:hypothetical protein